MTLRVLCDSGALLPVGLPVTVVPYSLSWGGRWLLDGRDIDVHSAYQRITQAGALPTLRAPTVEMYRNALARQAQGATGMIVVTTSRLLSESWQNARLAAQHIRDHRPVEVVDSLSVCAGQGLLVQEALHWAGQQVALDEAVRRVRSATDRVYAMYAVESVAALLHTGVMTLAPVMMSMMTGSTPLVALESGAFVPTEKAATPIATVERLLEFAAEFTHVRAAWVVYSSPEPSPLAQTLAERLTAEAAARVVRLARYGPTMQALVGVHTTGLIIFEDALSPDAHEDDTL